MRVLKVVTAIAAFAAVAAASAPPEKELAAARETSRQMMQSTKALLEAQVQSMGAAGALGACSREAQEMAKARAADGWTVRRVSLKARNRADRPDAWERRQLVALQASHAAKPLAADFETYEVVRVKGRPVLRYLKPITIPGPLCLQCHGARSDMAAPVRDSLARLYPDDPAHGYRVGDLRGAVSVSIPIQAR